jgi:hypothetical protein
MATNCFFYTLSQHLTGSEDHQLLLRLHIVIELLLNIEFYMNFTNGCISVFGGYVNVHSTANGAYHSDQIASTVTNNAQRSMSYHGHGNSHSNQMPAQHRHCKV